SNPYQCYQLLRFADHDSILSKEEKEYLKDLVHSAKFDLLNAQREENEVRYKRINEILADCLQRQDVTKKNISARLDKVLLHPVGGYLIFMGMLFLIFQAIFAWAEWP